MKTNLIFKRVVKDGVDSRVEMKVVSVEIPEINSNEGWSLVSSCDSINIVDSTSKPSAIKLAVSGDKFISNVEGTARLIRSQDKIFITYRKGKKTLNQTAPNSVCISDSMKQLFFRDIKSTYGSTLVDYALYSDTNIFSKWDKFMDEEYQRQLQMYNTILASNK